MSQNFMIMRSSIAFEDLLASSTAQQVMQFCPSLSQLSRKDNPLHTITLITLLTPRSKIESGNTYLGVIGINTY